MADKSIILDGIVLHTVTEDMSGNVYCVAAEGETYAAYHYDKRTGMFNRIISGVAYRDCLAATVKYREGERY